MYNKHQTSAKGDMSFIESLLPESVKIQHVDSYNIDNKKRFQGCFMYDFAIDKLSTCNDAPLAILKIAKSYSIRVCTQCGDTPHIMWTITFE